MTQDIQTTPAAEQVRVQDQVVNTSTMQAPNWTASMAVTAHAQLNAHINTIAGNNPINTKDADALKHAYSRQVKLIESEFIELAEALKVVDVKEIRDGIADVIVTCDGMMHRLGIAKYGFANPVKATEFDPETFGDMLEQLQKCAADNYLTEINPIDIENPEKTIGDISLVFIGFIRGMHSLSQIFELDVQKEQEAVYASNLSKFDTDEEVAKAGVEKYARLGVKTSIHPQEVNGITYYVIKSSEDQVVDGKDYPQGKFLKSVNFFEPRFEPLEPGNTLLQIRQHYEVLQTPAVSTEDSI